VWCENHFFNGIGPQPYEPNTAGYPGYELSHLVQALLFITKLMQNETQMVIMLLSEILLLQQLLMHGVLIIL
jgi:hypothetical protein